MFHLSRLWVGKGKKGLNLPIKCVSGVEKVFSPVVSSDPERCRGACKCSGEGSLALWPMIKPDGHSAGVKRVKLHSSGSW